MVNRSIQAKVVKLKRRRRLAPRKYYADYVNVNPVRKPEFVGSVRTHFANGTTSYKEAELRARNEFIRAMFPRFCINPNTNKPYEATDPYLEARRRQREILDEDIPITCNIILVKNRFRKLVFFFNIGHTKQYFVEEDYIGGFIRRSITYGARRRAISAYENDRIVWQEPFDLPPQPGASPPRSG